MMMLGILLMVFSSVFGSMVTAVHYDHVCSPALSPAQVAVGYMKEDNTDVFDEIANDLTVRQQWLRSEKEASDAYRVEISGTLRQSDVHGVTYTYDVTYREGSPDVMSYSPRWTCADGRTTDDRSLCAH